MWHSHLWLPAGLYNSNIPAASETENVVFSSLRHASPWQPLLWPRASSTLWAWIHFNDSHMLNLSWQGCVWNLKPASLPIVQCQVHSEQWYQVTELTGKGRGISFFTGCHSFPALHTVRLIKGTTRLLRGLVENRHNIKLNEKIQSWFCPHS